MQAVEGCGEVQLKLEWTFSKTVAKAVKRSGGGAAASGQAAVVAAGLVSSSGNDFATRQAKKAGAGSRREEKKDGAKGGKKGGGGGGGGGGKLSKEERQKREDEAQAELAKLRDMDAKMVNGDYQVQVHIIECRDLAGEDASGSCDPVITVTVLDQSQTTSIKEQVRDVVFDELLFFNFKGIGREELGDGTVKVSCFDADTIGRNDLVGSYQFDLMGVYYKDSHEIYRSWVALIDPEDEDQSGTQGYLKISITILGPGDTQVVHDGDTLTAL